MINTLFVKDASLQPAHLPSTVACLAAGNPQETWKKQGEPGGKRGPTHLLLLVNSALTPHLGPTNTLAPILPAFTPIIGGVITYQHTEPSLQTLIQTGEQFSFELPRVFHIHLPPNCGKYCKGKSVLLAKPVFALRLECN